MKKFQALFVHKPAMADFFDNFHHEVEAFDLQDAQATYKLLEPMWDGKFIEIKAC